MNTLWDTHYTLAVGGQLKNTKYMILKDKIAIIYGATGSVGCAVSIKFASEGAIVILVARNKVKLKHLSDKIHAFGGNCQSYSLDAMSENKVVENLRLVKRKYSRIDISLNLISINDVQGKPLSEISLNDFLSPITVAMKTQFITAISAAKIMGEQENGVILMLTAQAAKLPYINTGGFGVACAAMEALTRQLAKEFGDKGVRAICLRSSGSPDAKGVNEIFTIHAKNEGISREEFENKFAERTMLKRLPILNEVAETAAIMASNYSSAVTATIVNLTCGEIAD